MNRIALIALLAGVPGVALAQVNAAERQLEVYGDAPPACLLSSPTVTGAANATLQDGGRTGTVQFGQLVDPGTAEARAASINLAFPVICNSAHTLTIRSARGGLVRDGDPANAPGFRDRLSYQVAADWAGRSAAGASDTFTPVGISTQDGAAGSVSVAIQIPGGGDPLVAGSYSDSVVVELQAAI